MVGASQLGGNSKNHCHVRACQSDVLVMASKGSPQYGPHDHGFKGWPGMPEAQLPHEARARNAETLGEVQGEEIRQVWEVSSLRGGMDARATGWGWVHATA